MMEILETIQKKQEDREKKLNGIIVHVGHLKFLNRLYEKYNNEGEYGKT